MYTIEQVRSFMKATLVSRICFTLQGTIGQMGPVQLAPQSKFLDN